MSQGPSNESNEKIQQHVVAASSVPLNNEPTAWNDIEKIPKDTEEFQLIDIHLQLPYFLLKDLTNNIKKKFGENGPSLNGHIRGRITEWNKEFEMQQHVGSLSFRGSFPRRDVLERLQKIAMELETWPGAPIFKRWRLESIIEKIIGRKDPRTFRAYFDCIVSFVERKNGGQLSFNADYDLSNFRQIVETALIRLDGGELEKD